MPEYCTHKPLVLLGATGKLSSEVAFYSQLLHFSPHLVLCGSSEERLNGLKDELEEANFCSDLCIETTCSITEATRLGGYILFAKSVRGGAKNREDLLLQNAPYAVETGKALAHVRNKVERVICVSNPSDLMGLTLLVHSGIDPHLVMSLSSLDTERLRRSLCRRLHVRKEEISSAYTLGSHDRQMAPILGSITINGKGLSEMGMTAKEQDEIVREVREAGISIYKQRGQTAYQSPAVHCMKLLMATDNNPFLLPTACYHNSTRYPYSYLSLPTIVDSSGCHHQPIILADNDLKRLDGSFASINQMRDKLIATDLLPPPNTWNVQLQECHELVRERE